MEQSSTVTLTGMILFSLPVVGPKSMLGQCVDLQVPRDLLAQQVLVWRSVSSGSSQRTLFHQAGSSATARPRLSQLTPLSPLISVPFTEETVRLRSVFPDTLERFLSVATAPMSTSTL